MKNKETIFLLVALSIFNLVACTTTNPNTPIVEGTETRIYSPFAPTMAPTDTNTPFPTFTLLTTFTLSPAQVNVNITKLLHPNTHCSLPCLLGIVPGGSPWLEVQQSLLSKGIVPHFDDVSPVPNYYVSIPNYYNYYFTFFVKDGIVNSIQLKSEFNNDTQGFKNTWADYAPELVISNYGRPSRVWLKSVAYVLEGPTSVIPFDMWLFYDQLGFFIHYSNLVTYGPIYYYCPSFATYGSPLVELELYTTSSESPVSLTEMAKQTVPPLDLEKATNLTIDELYKLYLFWQPKRRFF